MRKCNESRKKFGHFNKISKFWSQIGGRNYHMGKNTAILEMSCGMVTSSGSLLCSETHTPPPTPLTLKFLAPFAFIFSIFALYSLYLKFNPTFSPFFSSYFSFPPPQKKKHLPIFRSIEGGARGEIYI